MGSVREMRMHSRLSRSRHCEFSKHAADQWTEKLPRLMIVEFINKAGFSDSLCSQPTRSTCVDYMVCMHFTLPVDFFLCVRFEPISDAHGFCEVIT